MKIAAIPLLFETMLLLGQSAATASLPSRAILLIVSLA